MLSQLPVASADAKKMVVVGLLTVDVHNRLWISGDMWAKRLAPHSDRANRACDLVCAAESAKSPRGHGA